MNFYNNFFYYDILQYYNFKLSKENKVPILFWYGVCKPKTKL